MDLSGLPLSHQKQISTQVLASLVCALFFPPVGSRQSYNLLLYGQMISSSFALSPRLTAHLILLIYPVIYYLCPHKYILTLDIKLINIIFIKYKFLIKVHSIFSISAVDIKKAKWFFRRDPIHRNES